MQMDKFWQEQWNCFFHQSSDKTDYNLEISHRVGRRRPRRRASWESRACEPEVFRFTSIWFKWTIKSVCVSLESSTGGVRMWPIRRDYNRLFVSTAGFLWQAKVVGFRKFPEMSRGAHFGGRFWFREALLRRRKCAKPPSLNFDQANPNPSTHWALFCPFQLHKLTQWMGVVVRRFTRLS